MWRALAGECARDGSSSSLGEGLGWECFPLVERTGWEGGPFFARICWDLLGKGPLVERTGSEAQAFS